MQTTGICNANNPRFFLHKSWSKLGLAKAEILRRFQGALLAMGSRLPKKGRRREGSGQGAIVPVLRILGSPYLSGRFPDSGLSQLPPSTKASVGLLFWKNYGIIRIKDEESVSFCFSLFFWDRTLLCIPEWPGTHSPLISTFRVLRLQLGITVGQLLYPFFFF